MQNNTDTVNQVEDETRTSESILVIYFNSMDASTILNNCRTAGGYFCFVVSVFIVAAVIFTTAFATCDNVELKNNTNKWMYFNRVAPFGAEVDHRYWPSKTYNSASFGAGNDHVSLSMSNGEGTLISYSNGKCELKDGSSNLEVKKYANIFFYTCFCELRDKDSVSQNSIATTRYLRGVEPIDVEATGVLTKI